MSFAVVNSRALSGMNAPLVEVEVHLSNGLPQCNIVGLPDTEVKESRDRVRAAILQSGFEFPTQKITVNLAPADLPKESGRFDLPIAIGILAASGQVAPDVLADYELAGELALSGSLRPIRGALAMALHSKRANRAFILPHENAQQAAVMPQITAYGARSLGEVVAHLNGVEPLQQVAVAQFRQPENAHLPDLRDVKGQHTARLALEIAAAGGHSLLMLGPPGTGKSMLAQRLPSILPPLTDDELASVWALHSLLPQFSGSLPQHTQRPFRAPHHSASAAALVGGGSDPKPGEISLAHQGILFLDELPEFDRRVLEMLREPLESGEIHISRATRQATYPAKFQLIAAMNPCPCGYLGHPSKPCRCTPDAIKRYRDRISGPLLDRIDLTIEVPALAAAELVSAQQGEDSATVLQRVLAARERQYARQGKTNAALSSSELDEQAAILSEAREALGEILERLSLSARSFHRILRVARTLADLAGDENVTRAHVLRAIGFRRAL
ncbi:YifB family Mg chelatase-like AAA ATPase [Alysiella filiformis]|uniref:Magnesium chelatase family protein n=1 Tax=Alysiella filiformis DSM 16848 TaxID=1120981 RepID=A0A286EH01_9NEIS|nr:YifB family Mg chelatase-like AAA ATPase [Alysiella filiformis]QMT32352.1 YifB family Mg chelatase-like AAA ATPase [Alysiella filiformis]UBQ56728.1 YifB family Mg chelatase-like AAA ATPase [Alysiella filiformis DSM 16848]SOD70201.1 magnesium chelatase family protein [Alysiella filiformis DSM 16848]